VFLLPAAIALLPALVVTADEGTDFFEKNIRPSLVKNCYACHTGKSPQGLFHIDSREGMRKGGASGVAAVVPGKPEESLLLKAIQHRHKDLKMPPTGKKMPEAEIQAYVEWIKMGAPDPRETATKLAEAAPAYDWDKVRKHWAYQPVRRDVQPPAIADAGWNTTEVDRFLKAALDAKGLRPLAPAPKAALLRRLTYDLTGLPPTPEEMKAFLRNPSIEAAVDRLLATRAYGEHWGRHWLDIVRYADSGGDASDFPIPEMYRYRNYVIRSIQEDKPMNLFLREQIAGDLLPAKDDEDRADKLVATSYLANARRFGQTTSEFYLTIDDAIENIGRSFLGLSTGCARCHDHKFDPIPNRDYYAMYGILQSSKFAHGGLEHHQYLDGLLALNKKDAERLEKVQKQMFDAYAIVKKGVGASPKAEPELRMKYLQAKDELNRIRQEFPADIPMAYGVSEGSPVNARIFVKGDPGTKGPEVERGFLEILGGQKVPADHKGSGRDLLAQWIAEDRNPLTARVLVNRVWLWHFGRGLVNTPNDFGTRGEAPSHPELLDYLTARFIEDGWSLKKLHKRILLTRAYQTASGNDTANATKDPNNQYYWRFDRRRLAAEEVRDTLLAVSGELDPTAGGPHPFPPRASYTFTQHKPFVGEPAQYDTNRRSVYLMQQRFRRHPFLELFDGGDTNSATPYRSRESTPLQSLYFFNDEFLHKRADALAVRVGMADATATGRIAQAYSLLFGRAPSQAESQAGLTFLAASRKAHGASPDIAEDQRSRAALASYMRVLLASNEFFYVD
jgi:hypothetical protein